MITSMNLVFWVVTKDVFDVSKPNWNCFRIQHFYAFDLWIWNQFCETIETCSRDSFANESENCAVVLFTLFAVYD